MPGAVARPRRALAAGRPWWHREAQPCGMRRVINQPHAARSSKLSRRSHPKDSFCFCRRTMAQADKRQVTAIAGLPGLCLRLPACQGDCLPALLGWPLMQHCTCDLPRPAGPTSILRTWRWHQGLQAGRLKPHRSCSLLFHLSAELGQLSLQAQGSGGQDRQEGGPAESSDVPVDLDNLTPQPESSAVQARQPSGPAGSLDGGWWAHGPGLVWAGTPGCCGSVWVRCVGMRGCASFCVEYSAALLASLRCSGVFVTRHALGGKVLRLPPVFPAVHAAQGLWRLVWLLMGGGLLLLLLGRRWQQRCSAPLGKAWSNCRPAQAS